MIDIDINKLKKYNSSIKSNLTKYEEIIEQLNIKFYNIENYWSKEERKKFFERYTPEFEKYTKNIEQLKMYNKCINDFIVELEKIY